MKAIKIISTVILALTFIGSGFSQVKPTIALVSIDCQGLEVDNSTMASLVRLELEKINQFEVLDKYDVSNIIKRNNINEDIFGKTEVISAGKILGADKMLTGSAEKFGETIIMIFRMVDVESERIEKTSVMEFLNVQSEIQTMVLVTLNELLDIENDPHLVDLLIDYNLPITSAKTNVNLNGPRMGAILTTGRAGERLKDSESNGGYDMYPVTTMFGYQFEKQYLSSGNFQALVEVIGSLNGLETGKFVPSVAVLNGFRFNKSGFEFGLGPVVRLTRTSNGYFDEAGEWHRTEEIPDGTNYELVKAIDSRGQVEPSLSMIVAVGKTFRSGYLNMPVNLYFSPRKNGNVIGLTFGFNTQKKPDLKK